MARDRAVQALDKIVRQYPQGTALLFEGAGLNDMNYSGANLAAALRRGDITPGQLYDHTFGAYDDILGGFTTSPLGQAMDSKAAEAKKTNEKTKFTDVLTGLLGVAGQAADIYGKFKNPGGQAAQGGGQDQPVQSGSKPPWILIAGAGILVVLVIVLLVMRKK